MTDSDRMMTLAHQSNAVERALDCLNALIAYTHRQLDELENETLTEGFQTLLDAKNTRIQELSSLTESLSQYKPSPSQLTETYDTYVRLEDDLQSKLQQTMKQKMYALLARHDYERARHGYLQASHSLDPISRIFVRPSRFVDEES